MPRITDAVISKYQRARIHRSDFVRGEQTTFRANFNGAFDEDVLIDSVTWRTSTPWALIITNPQIELGRRAVSVDVLMGYAGPGSLKCIVTLSNGQIRNQLYEVSIIDNPWMDESYPSPGATSVTDTFVPLSVTVSPTEVDENVVEGMGDALVATFTATVTGGDAPYTYEWGLDNELEPGAFALTSQTGNTIQLVINRALPQAEYTVEVNLEVTDAQGATASPDMVPVSVTIVGI